MLRFSIGQPNIKADKLGEAADILGNRIARDVEKVSLQVYQEASVFAAKQGIIIADTKLEFGVDRSTDPPSLVLIDEVLTPDSSRFWSAAAYEIGRSQESFDKQYLRGRLVAINHWSDVEP